MFKKKPSIKTLSPLRSSDRRRIADRIISEYGLTSEPGPGAPEDGDSTENKTTAHTALRNQVLPDSCLSAKFTTTHGPQLSEVSGTVYVGSHGAKEQRVLWVKIDEKLYPSAYTLWHVPGLVPLLHTPALVVEKIKGGADLMTPGLAGPPFPANATKGSIVAVASLDNPSVPVVLGTCEIDISTLKETRGVKGKAVEVFHWAGDELWDWSTSGKAGVPVPSSLDGWAALMQDAEEDDEDEEETNLASGVNGLSLNGQQASGGVSLAGTSSAPPSARTDDAKNELGTAVEGDEEEPEKALTPEEIDAAFVRAFLYGVHHQIQENPTSPKYGFDFPLSQSSVMADLVLPYLPAYTEKQAEQLHIKKTSWKNIKKFIKSLHKDKLLLSKDVKTEMLVLDIDFDDAAIRGFVPYRLPKREKVNPVGSGEPAPSSQSSADDSIGQTLKVANLYKVRDSLSFLPALASGSKTFLTSEEVKRMVTSYAEAERLVSPTNKRLVNLDPSLSNSLFSTSEKLDTEVLAKGSIPRDALIERVLANCAAYHLILRNDETSETSRSKPKAGPAPRIEIVLETRSGNKTATRVHGLEPYGIAAAPLADELRKVCAGSTSVEPFRAGKGMEVMVQGPQKEAVLKALEKRGVSKRWVDFVDKTKGKKK